VDTSTDPSKRRFLGSPLAARIGSVFLAIFILAYVLIISVSRFVDFHSPRDFLVLGSLWLLALVALGLLARAWLPTKRQTTQ
jgi:uncharacterized membrane protein